METKYHYVVREITRYEAAEIVETEKLHPFVFVHASMAEMFMFTRIASLKADFYAESYRDKSEDNSYIAASHLYKAHKQIKLVIDRLELIEKK